MKRELTFNEFADRAPKAHIDMFIKDICGGSYSYYWQLREGIRSFGYKKAQKVTKYLAELGYNVPLHKLRPDIWGAA